MEILLSDHPVPKTNPLCVATKQPLSVQQEEEVECWPRLSLSSADPRPHYSTPCQCIIDGPRACKLFNSLQSDFIFLLHTRPEKRPNGSMPDSISAVTENISFLCCLGHCKADTANP